MKKDVDIFPLAIYDEIVIKKPTSLLISSPDFTALQAKIYFVFFFIAEKTLEQNSEKRLFALKLSDLRKVLGNKSNNSGYYKKKIEEMLGKKIMQRKADNEVFNDFTNTNLEKIPALKSINLWRDDIGDIVCTFELPDNIIALLPK